MNLLLIILCVFLNNIVQDVNIIGTNMVSVKDIYITKKKNNKELNKYALYLITEKDTVILHENIENLKISDNTQMLLKTDSIEIDIGNVSNFLNKNKGVYIISIAVGEEDTDLNEFEYYNANGELQYIIYSPEHDYLRMNYIKFEIVK
jgi:hypothetical protein